ncbi:MAG: NADPH-dependent FMN reductase [Bacteriovoracaceae bacterium]
MKKIAIILASEQKNLELANHIKKEIEGTGNEACLIKLIDLNLPLYTSRAEKEHSPAELLGDSLTRLKESQGIIFIAPEYNGGIPPMLTNFLAWVSRSTKNWRENLTGKPAALGTYSGGPGSNVITSLRLQLSYIGMNVVGRAMQFHSKNDFNESDIKAVVGELIKIIPQ